MYQSERTDFSHQAYGSAKNLGKELQSEFPNLSLVHEIEIRGCFGWRILCAISQCMMEYGAEPVSIHARKYGDHAESITCRIRALDDLDAAVVALRQLDGVRSVILSHHIGRASGIGAGSAARLGANVSSA